MPDLETALRSHGRRARALGSPVVIASYALDWVVLIAVGVVGYVLGNITPKKRPFSLQDPNISFPYTVHETVSSKLLLICNSVIPVVVILAVTLVVAPAPGPGPATSASAGTGTTPRSPRWWWRRNWQWRRRLWELHAGWLGLALSLVTAWIVTQGIKNLCGKPRPDLLARCQPDFARVFDYVVGYRTPADDGAAAAAGPYNGQLVSADICKNPDAALLDDGFRSYPSGHSSSAAAGLIYLSLFLTSKFAVAPSRSVPQGGLHHARPTQRLRGGGGGGGGGGRGDAAPRGPRPLLLSSSSPYRAVRNPSHADGGSGPPSPDPTLPPPTPTVGATTTNPTTTSTTTAAKPPHLGPGPSPGPGAAQQRLKQKPKQKPKQDRSLSSASASAAAPLLLLLAAALPVFLAVFVAASRWCDFRHHGFDILFGFALGAASAFLAFGLCHQPVGAGLARGPRSRARAFWGRGEGEDGDGHGHDDDDDEDDDGEDDEEEEEWWRRQQQGRRGSDVDAVHGPGAVELRVRHRAKPGDLERSESSRGIVDSGYA
ncbi:PAP2 superfamily-domain-containing protein [Xylariaceae sp. FL0804]|nr:PAP2 superfamily-domain-containing protein [Xylariaceae sp. FL0804]